MNINLNVDAFIDEIVAKEKLVEHARDEIDNMISEMESLKEVCNRAYESLRDAREALSELV